MKISLYIAWACFRNVVEVVFHVMHSTPIMAIGIQNQKALKLCPLSVFKSCGRKNENNCVFLTVSPDFSVETCFRLLRCPFHMVFKRINQIRD